MTGEDIAQPAPPIMRGATWLSVERLLYGVAIMVALWLRLWALGAQPLSPWEASNSWPAWLTASALTVESAPSPNSALYYGLQWLLFWFGVNSDAGARFWSAVAGVALVVLVWWWRDVLGRRVALITTFLLAIDSWLLAFSRLADGAIVSVGLGLLALVAVSQVAAQPASVRWKQVLAVSMGLLVVSGPMGWNFLPVAALWVWLNWSGLSAAGIQERTWLLWVAGSAAFGATFLFARMDGVAWLASGTSVWLSQFDGGIAGPMLPLITGGYGIWWPWQRLWADAAPLLPLGIGGLALLVLRLSAVEAHSRNMLTLCAGWLLWGVVLAMLPGRSPLALPVLGLPLLILSAFALDALLRNLPRDLDWREVGAVILTLTILLVSGHFWLTALLASRNYDPILAQATMVIFGLVLAILIAFALWANRRDAAWVAASMVSVLLVVFYVRGTWKLSFGNVLTEPAGWQATVAHPEVRLLVSDMETLSAHRSGDPYQLPVQVQIAPHATRDDRVVPARPDPVLGWELRNMRNLTWVASPSVAQDADPLPLVVTPATLGEEIPQLDLPNNYAGSRYHVDAWWLPETLSNGESTLPPEAEEEWGRTFVASVQPWWRWLIYREATEAPQNRDVILWAPLDSTQ